MVFEKNIKDNANILVVDEAGGFQVLEHQKDLSVSNAEAIWEYYASKMNVKRRQLLIHLEDSSCTLQAGAMQWMSGNVSMNSGIKGAGDFIGKMFSAAVTGETASKPQYSGTGSVMLEPTYQHIVLIDVSGWGSIVLDDGLFLACDSNLKHKIVARSNVSSALLGGEGLFNLCLEGKGIVAIESPVPMDEIIPVYLENDCLKIDGNMALAWSSTLNFTVEKAGKSLLGSAASGEGLVNVYRGTGTVLLAPTIKDPVISANNAGSENSKSKSKTEKFGQAIDVLDNITDIIDLFN